MASGAHCLCAEQLKTALCGSTNGFAVAAYIELEWRLVGYQCTLESGNSLGHRPRRSIAAKHTVELLLVGRNRIQFSHHFVHRSTHFVGCSDWPHMAGQRAGLFFKRGGASVPEQ